MNKAYEVINLKGLVSYRRKYVRILLNILILAYVVSCFRYLNYKK